MKRKQHSDFAPRLSTAKKPRLTSAQMTEKETQKDTRLNNNFQIFFDIPMQYSDFFDVNRYIVLAFGMLPFDHKETCLAILNSIQTHLRQLHFDHLIDFSKKFFGTQSYMYPKFKQVKFYLPIRINVNEKKTVKEINRIFRKIEHVIENNYFEDKRVSFIDYFTTYYEYEEDNELENKPLNSPILLSINLESMQNNQKRRIKQGIQLFYQKFGAFFQRVYPHVVSKIKLLDTKIMIYLTDSQSCKKIKDIKQALTRLKYMITDCLEDQHNFDRYEKNHLMSDQIKRDSIDTLYRLVEAEPTKQFPKELNAVIVGYL